MIRKLFRLGGALLVLGLGVSGGVAPVAAQQPSEEITVRQAPYTIHKEVSSQPFAKSERPAQRITVTKDGVSGDLSEARADACRELNRRFPPSQYQTVGPDDCAVTHSDQATARAYANRAER